MNLSTHQMDRAAGVILASAAGDALGAPYEFGPALPDDAPVRFGRGALGHGYAEWTDDTSMAMPVLQALAAGSDLRDPAVLGGILAAWREWARTSPDVGKQTKEVLGGLSDGASETDARAAALARHESTGRSGGNGSLMRTGPVALGYLADGQEAALVDASGRVAQLTHWERDNTDACALWGLAIRHAVRTGELDVRAGLSWLPEERRERWAGLIDEALAPGAHPRDFADGNGWVVRAFQSGLTAVHGATSLVDALERAVRGGGDTDTVAAIAGSLAGAVYGSSAVPVAWQLDLHGWPGLRATDLPRLAALAANGGRPDSQGWPTAEIMVPHEPMSTLVRLPDDDGVWLGSLDALPRLATEAPEVRAVVSLCRVGTAQVPDGLTSVQVRLIDRPGENPHLDTVLAGTVDTIARLRAEGHGVFVHCLEARSRTAAVAALYLMRHRGVPEEVAWERVAGVLPNFRPEAFLREGVRRVRLGGGGSAPAR